MPMAELPPKAISRATQAGETMYCEADPDRVGQPEAVFQVGTVFKM